MSKSTTNSTKVGAVVLCGGKSERMGIHKWQLPVGQTTLLEHIVAELNQQCSPIVVSIAANSDKPSASDLPNVFQIADQVADAGPLEGIRASLEFLESRCEYAFVTACDVPHVSAKVVEYLLQRAGDAEAVIPIRGNRRYGMTSLLKTSAHTKIKELIAANRLRVSYLADALDCLELPVEELKTVDQELLSLTNINTPQEYLCFLAEKGLQCDEATRKLLSP